MTRLVFKLARCQEILETGYFSACVVKSEVSRFNRLSKLGYINFRFFGWLAAMVYIQCPSMTNDGRGQGVHLICSSAMLKLLVWRRPSCVFFFWTSIFCFLELSQKSCDDIEYGTQKGYSKIYNAVCLELRLYILVLEREMR
jgi:hypothetical protein